MEKIVDKKLLTLTQACGVLNCHPNTLRNWEKQGKIKCIRFGTRGDRRFVASEIDEFIERRRNIGKKSEKGSLINKYKTPDTLLCQQDCIQFLRGLDNESIDLVVTDPAYSGMNKHLNFGRGRIVGDYQKDITKKWFKEFEDTEENYFEFLHECHRVLKPNRHIYIMFDSYSLLTLGSIVREVFDVKNIVVWDKKAIGMGHYFRRRHELILFASKGKRRISARNIPDIWEIRRLHRASYPTQKPVEIFSQMIRASAEPGFVVCDPFFGSGSAAIAAIKQKCKFIGSDISEKGFEFAKERIKVFYKTGEDIGEARRNKVVGT